MKTIQEIMIYCKLNKITFSINAKDIKTVK